MIHFLDQSNHIQYQLRIKPQPNKTKFLPLYISYKISRQDSQFLNKTRHTTTNFHQCQVKKMTYSTPHTYLKTILCNNKVILIQNNNMNSASCLPIFPCQYNISLYILSTSNALYMYHKFSIRPWWHILQTHH